MFGRETIKAKRILVMVFAALFVLSFAYPALAGDNMLTFKGEIVAVDNYAKTLTVTSLGRNSSAGMDTKSAYTFKMDKMTNVVGCNENKSLTDIMTGEKVTVTYHEKEGSLIADTIEIGIPIVVACYQ